MKNKLILTLILTAIVAQLGFGQTLLFTYNTGVDISEVNQRCSPHVIGPSHIGISFISTATENESRFVVFDLKGKVLMTLLGKDQGWDNCWANPSPTGSFILSKWGEPRGITTYTFYAYNRRNKSWTANNTIADGAFYGDNDAGSPLSTGIWAITKNIDGKAVVFVYRY